VIFIRRISPLTYHRPEVCHSRIALQVTVGHESSDRASTSQGSLLFSRVVAEARLVPGITAPVTQ